MISEFNAKKAKENSYVGPYTYESLLQKVLKSAEAASKMKFDQATVGVDDEDVTTEIIDRIEIELKNRDFEVLISKYPSKPRTYIKVSW